MIPASFQIYPRYPQSAGELREYGHLGTYFWWRRRCLRWARIRNWTDFSRRKDFSLWSQRFVWRLNSFYILKKLNEPKKFECFCNPTISFWNILVLVSPNVIDSDWSRIIRNAKFNEPRSLASWFIFFPNHLDKQARSFANKLKQVWDICGFCSSPVK